MLIAESLKNIIPKRAHCCDKHKEPFSYGQEYISYLVFEDDSWKRSDYCLNCWSEIEVLKKEGTFWKGKIPIKKAKESPLKESIYSAFRDLIEEEKEEKKDLIFMVALLLERQKRLLYRPEFKSNIEYRTYEVPETGEVLRIKISSIKKEQAEALLEEFKSQLFSYAT